MLHTDGEMVRSTHRYSEGLRSVCVNEEHPEINWAVLRRVLVDHYDDLHRRLSRRLGSDDLARESLHELYLRMDRPVAAGTLRNPVTYIVAVAVNLARDRLRTDNRRARRIVVDALHGVVDESPGPDRMLEGRSEFDAFTRALARITPRQRAIVVAARLEQLSGAEIALRMNISRSLVQLELQRGLASCAAYLAQSADR